MSMMMMRASFLYLLFSPTLQSTGMFRPYFESRITMGTQWRLKKEKVEEISFSFLALTVEAHM